MPIFVQLEQLETHVVVRLTGEPKLGEFVACLEQLGVQSRSWPLQRLLFDARAIRTMTSFTDHYSIGQAVARNLRHIAKMASVVAPDRITRASEKTAKQAGVNLTVFTDESAALTWLLSP